MVLTSLLLSLSLAAWQSHAHETSSRDHRPKHAGVCSSQILPDSNSLPANPVCISLADHAHAGFAAGDERPQHILGGASTICSLNSTDPACQSHSHRWSSVKPCMTAKESGKEICVFADAAFAENRGISIVTTPERAKFFSQLEAFTDPSMTKGINQDLVETRRRKFDVVEMPGKGFGIVANQYIHRGELILANTASLMVDYAVYDLENEEYLELQARAVDALPTPHRNLFLNMSTHGEADFPSHVERIAKLAATNAFDIEPDHRDAEKGTRFYTVFPEIARTNHDCRSNADYHFDYSYMTQWIHAIRPINQGEEITISYIDPIQSRKKRGKNLQNWGFQCSCAACTQGEALGRESDERVAQIDDLVGELKSYRASSRATPQMAELVVGLYEQERLWDSIYEAYTYVAIEYNGVGEPWLATKYARLAIEQGLLSVGEKDNDVREMKKLAKNPWGHWSWMLRTRKRMSWGVVEEYEEDEDEEDDE